MAGCEVMHRTIVQHLPKLQVNERRSSTICAVVERHDDHSGDDLVCTSPSRTIKSASHHLELISLHTYTFTHAPHAPSHYSESYIYIVRTVKIVL